MIEIRILAFWWINYLCAIEFHSLPCVVISILTQFGYIFCMRLTTSYAWNKSIKNITSKALLTQTGTRNSGALVMRRLHPQISSVRLLASFTESPVKHNHSPDGARRPTTKYVGPSHLAPSFGVTNLWKIFTIPESRVFQAADGEDLMILACTAFDWSTRVTDRLTDG